MIVDGQFHITISEDALLVRGTFKPAATGGQALTLGDVEHHLMAEAVTAGIHWDKIRDALFTCNTEHRTIEDLVVAEGQRPVDEIPESLMFSPIVQALNPVFGQIDSKGNYHPLGEDDDQLLTKSVPESGGRIDHRESGSITVIHKDQMLAVKFSGKPGVTGVDVHGVELPCAAVEIRQMEPGLNTRSDEKGNVYSTVSGRFIWDKERFGVDTNIQIDGDVGYKTGNIRFPGNVLLKGVIQDGFKLWVGGDLTSGNTIDAYEIFCKGSVRCSEGIIGKGRAVVRVKGSIEAKFIENCHIDSFESVVVKSAVVNSDVNSKTGIIVEKGRVIGGRLCFQSQLICDQLGNSSGVPTLVAGGIDFVAKRTLDYSQNRFQELSIAEQKLRSRHEQSPDTNTVKKLDALARELHRLRTEITAMLDATAPEAESFVEVRGSVYPGVTINFGRIELTIHEAQSKKRFRPDVAAGRVIVEDL